VKLNDDKILGDTGHYDWCDHCDSMGRAGEKECGLDYLNNPKRLRLDQLRFLHGVLAFNREEVLL
jgi:hypothetical protein